MDVRKLGNILTGGGIVLLVIAIIWWAKFFSEVAKAVASPGAKSAPGLSDVVQCLYSNGGACGLISGIASLAGATPYNPVVFWVGAAALITGIILRFSAKN